MGTKVTTLVKERYGRAALSILAGDPKAACCGTGGCCDTDPITSNLYDAAEVQGIPPEAVLASLGCGNPTALAELTAGETVLDLGSGGGIDVLLSAQRVGPTGKAYGLDMTDEMLELANRNKQAAGATNVEFLRGEITRIPLPSESVDVIISNCVINLAHDKAQVIREAFRVLKPGGRFAVSDVITRGEIPAEVRRNAAMWVGCIAGALDEQHFLRLLREAGFANASIEPTRIYTSDDARIFAESAGLDPERLAADIDGKFLSGFVRAIKPRPAPAFDLRPAEPHDLSAVATLLHTVSLPSDDIDPSLKGFFVATRGRAVVGTIGLERYGDAALLRSVATSPKARNTGIGAALVHRAIDAAQAAGISDLYLLTTNASEWAARFGFTPIARDQVADAVRHSPQFTGGACSSAAAMHRSLAG